MTYLEIINKILIRLREPEVSAVTLNSNPYAKLIGLLVNEAKAQVEDSWDWSVLRTTITGVTEQGIFNYEVNGANTRFKLLDLINDDTDTFLQLTSSTQFNKLFVAGDAQEGEPIYYSYNGISSDGDIQVDLYPIPDQDYTLRFNGVLRTEDLTEANERLLIPSEPVYLLALSYAIDERGEDNGQASAYALQRAKQSLNDAIAFDAARYPDEVTWSVC